MGANSTISTVRGTKRQMQDKATALRAQFGERGVEVLAIEKESRGCWRLRFYLTPERERIRQINLKLKGESELQLEDSQRGILAGIFAGAELLRFTWAGKPAWRLSSKHTRERAADVEILQKHGLIRPRIPLQAYILTPAGTREVLRRFGGNS